MKLCLPRRRHWRAVIYLCSLVLVLIAGDLLLARARRTIHPAFDTTRIVAPLQQDGSIDYLVAVQDYFGQGITHDNNAAAMIAPAIGPGGLASSQSDEVCDWLGIPRLPVTGNYFIPYEAFCAGRGIKPTQWTDLMQPRAQPLEFDEITKQWVKANEAPLTQIADAAKRPRFFIPMYVGHRTETMIEIQLRHVLPIRDACRAFQTRGLMRFADGDVAGFRQDLFTIHRLTHLLGQAPTLVERMLAVTGEISACEQERAAIAAGKLSSSDARAMAADLAALGDLPPLANAIDKGERYFALDLLQTFARVGPTRTAEIFAGIGSRSSWRFGPPVIFALVPMPFDELMRTINHSDDAVLAAWGEAGYPSRAAAISLLQQQQARYTTLQDMSFFDLFGTRWPVSVFTPTLLNLAQREETARVESRHTQVALILTAYKADHGNYPATLADLVPQYLPAVPADSFSEKPLVYAATPEGCTLYSVGPNMTDDGGKSSGSADDIVVHLR